MSQLGRLIPDISLSEPTFAARHRVLRLLLWAHLPVILVLAYFNGQFGSGVSTWMLLGSLGAMMLCGVIASAATSKRARSISVSIGLLLSADALVQAGGGLIDLHFHYFVVIALIGLYQDWIPFAIAVVLVAVQHFGVGEIAPQLVFGDHNHDDGLSVLGRALLHAGFVLAMAAAQMAYWHFEAAARRDNERQFTELADAGAGQLRLAADEAAQREELAKSEAEAQLPGPSRWPSSSTRCCSAPAPPGPGCGPTPTRR